MEGRCYVAGTLIHATREQVFDVYYGPSINNTANQSKSVNGGLWSVMG